MDAGDGVEEYGREISGARKERGMSRLDPWQKIMRAAKRGTGLRLNADEVWQLSLDDAIEQMATQERLNEEVRMADAIEKIYRKKRSTR